MAADKNPEQSRRVQPVSFTEDAKELFAQLDRIGSRPRTPAAAKPAGQQGKDSIAAEIARKHRLKNDDAEQNITLKKQTLRQLFRFLTCETIVIFLFALFQATAWPDGFRLDEWSFRVLVSATILQVAGMLFVAVRYLFPAGRQE